ncbi:AMP-binding protein [Marinospirillum alkaliphilum]|uniref:Acetyl-CoA synthetase n=1 Tax=Marinospirillum alkaliphilum DSM 21637 TaxID=1122209 RepID=A0A1K1YZ80_9GAMM|nr:AMP-binding protein [Marinospirillum alkaliphilum]SFX67238.1 acetyl-CoA synthetase [Marinospirillum alkaliphilum DSM 21637]
MAESKLIQPQDYAAFMQQFQLAAVESELQGSLAQGFNAYTECCGRHAQGSKANHPALVHEDTRGKVTTLTFAEMDALTGRMANLLKSQGVKPGDRVAAMLSRTPELLGLILASWRIGAVYQPLFTAFGYEAIEYRLTQAKTALVFTDADNREKFKPIKTLPKMVMIGSEADAKQWGDVHYASLLADQSSACDAPVLDAEQPFLQMFTSGTVGKSKGVAVPLKALPAFYIYMRYAIDLQESDRFWNMADPGWAYGLYYAITGPLLLGCTTHFNEAGFTAENTLEFLIKHRITNLASAPTAYRMMKSSGLLDGKASELSLRVASSAGEPLNTEVVNWVSDNLGCRVMDHYGQTETGMTCCCHHSLTHESPVGSMGMPMPGYRLAILDAEYNELEAGKTGQLAVDMENSPAFFFQGYTWQEKKPFHGKYYLTGDVVEKHADGTFWFAGRDDDIITTAGYRVGPTDVENTVLEHPAVAESAAVGKPDELRGYIIKSFVVLKAGQEPSDQLVKDIQALVRERLSAHAFPREIEFVDALPKTPSGKIQRFILRKQAETET